MTKPYPHPKLEPTMKEVKRVIDLIRPCEAGSCNDAMAEFMGGVGPEIQRQLEEKLQTTTSSNWATEKFKEFLLSLRAPIPDSTLSCALMKENADFSQLERAAAILAVTAKLYTYQASPTNGCYSFQDYDRQGCLGVTRVPGMLKDHLRREENSYHSVVLRKGFVFRVQVRDDNRSPLSIASIRHQLTGILECDLNSLTGSPGIANLTRLPRSEWAKLRQEIIDSSSSNASSLEDMEKAIVVLSLEEDLMPQDLSTSLEVIRKGRGESCRYYDKTVNFVVFSDGNAGASFEHVSVDGSHGILIIDEVSHGQKAIELCQKGQDGTGSWAHLPFCFERPTQQLSRDDREVSSFTLSFQPDALGVLHQAKLFSTWILFSLHLALRQIKLQCGHMMSQADQLIVMPCAMRHFSEGRADPIYADCRELRGLLDSLLRNEESDEELMMKFQQAAICMRKLVAATKEGLAVGPHIAALREMMPQDSKFLDYLNQFRTPEVILTGTSYITQVEAGVGNLYGTHQLAVTYCRSDNGINFCVGAKGYFGQVLKQLQACFESSMKAMARLAVPIAVAHVMDIKRPPTHGGNRDSHRSKDFTLVVHGGVGDVLLQRPDEKKLVEFSMKMALKTGSTILRNGGSATEAVEAAVAAMENCFLFNAGKGAVYNIDGKHELDAAIMDGFTKTCGSVSCVSKVKNPILGASAVMTTTNACQLSGAAADEFCAQRRLDIVDNSYFNTKLRMQHAQGVQGVGTVGAVAVDLYGKLASAASTGGLMNKLPGRVSDTAIIGAGLYANKRCAVACTGAGETFISHSIAAGIAKPPGRATTLENAVDAAINKAQKKQTAAGIIAVNQQGEVVVKFNTEMMFAGFSNGKGKCEAKVLTSEHPNLVQKREDMEEFLWKTDSCTVVLDRHPITNGVVLLCPPDHQTTALPLMDLPEAEFVDVLMEARKVAHLQSRQFGSRRSAIICEGLGNGSEYAKVIPLCGLAKEWEAVEAIGNFSGPYQGFVETVEGPKWSDHEMDNVQQRILKSNPNSENLGSSTFYGKAENGNLFARIVKQEIPSWRIWEDSKHVAFLSPFPNTPGFTVIVPRNHLPSDVFAMETTDFISLMKVAREVSRILCCALDVPQCAVVAEGMGVDYAHVKVIPLHAKSLADASCLKTAAQRNLKKVKWDSYPGYVTSAPGPQLAQNKLNKMANALRRTIYAPPGSWRNPEEHAMVAMSHPFYKGLYEVQDTLYHSAVEFFHEKLRYGVVMPPLTTETISSPMGLGSDSQPVSVELFNKDIYLADSMQFTLEYFLRLKEDILGTYYVSQSFRGEDPDSSHLNQFHHIECELLGDMEDAISVAEEFILFVSKALLQHSRFISEVAQSDQHIRRLVAQMELASKGHRLPRLTLEEALEFLAAGGYKDTTELVKDAKGAIIGKQLTRKGEQALIARFEGPVWVIEMDHMTVPFYQAYKKGGTSKALCADLLMGMGETLGLGQRHTTQAQVLEALAQHDVDPAPYKWYTEMRKHKPMLTSGWGLGVERFLAWALQHYDVRDLHVMPRLKGMTFAP